MHTNSKRNADILPNTNGLAKVKQKTHGYVTYRDPMNPKARRWARIMAGDVPLVEVPIKKAEVDLLPSPLPLGVTLIKKQMGAVTRSVLKGTASAIQHVTGVAGIN